MEFIEYLKNLDPKDWYKQVTDKWTVKDVVAHLVGWEKEVTNAVEKSHKTGKPAWFMKHKNWNKFNRESVEFYRNYSSNELLDEWQMWQGRLEVKVRELGEKELRKDKDMEYLFDEGEESSHYMHHWKQIREALRK